MTEGMEVLSSGRYAIYRIYKREVGGGIDGEEVCSLDEATVRNLQRLGGRLEDREAGAILLFRHGHETGKRFAIMSDADGKPGADEVAKKLGLWDPQAGKVQG